MDRLRTFASSAALVLILLALTASSASATILTDGSGNQLKTGTAITAESEGTTALHPPIGTVSCKKSHVGAKTTNDGGGEGVNVNGNIEALSFTECNATVTVLAKGTLSFAWASGSNATLFSTGTELTVEYAGYHCIFKTNNTKLGTFTGSARTGGNATLDIEATIPRTGGTSGAFCGAAAQWTGAYKFTNPSPLDTDNKPTEPPVGTAILTDGSGNQLKAGTSITAESESAVTELHPPIGSINCKKSHVGGKTTNDGGSESVNGNIEALSFTECNATVTVLAKGALSIVWTSGSNGTLYSTGTEVTVVYLGFHCIFRTSNTKLGTLTGSVSTGGNATLDIEATIPRTGGTGGAFCGSTAQWTGAYKFTNPSTLNIDEKVYEVSTVLTDGSGSQLKAGSSITAENEATIVLHAQIGDIKCEASHLDGKTSNAGGVSVNIKVEAFTSSKCNATVTVLAKGTLSITWASGSNATLFSTGTELTVTYLGSHCIFKTNNTKLGTITGSASTGGNATLDIEATIPRTGGTSGAFCGSEAQWTGAYKFTNPSTLNIDNEVPVESTVLTGTSGTQLKSGTSITAESEGTTELHPPIGSINCKKSHVGGKTTNDGGGVNVKANIEALSFGECNATVTVIVKGTLSFAWSSGSNATLYSTGTEVTVVYLGFHCIFRTSNTKLGTLTGSVSTGGNATLDIEATIPRTGGTGGAFCGSTAQWTGAYKFTAPGVLNID